VNRRAHHKSVDIAEDARRRAAAILDSAREEAGSIRRKSKEEIERQVGVLIRRKAARAELEAKRRFLLLREATIKRVWDAAEQRLQEMLRQPGYSEVLKRCAMRAARELGAGELVLTADPIGHDLLSAETLEQWSQEAGVRFLRAAKPASSWGGLIATSGRSQFDATFSTQLAAAHQSLRERVFELLSKGKA
jgi:V/A-type H+-transporting ATPase subunit E